MALIQTNQKAIFVAESGRRIDVVVLSIDEKRYGMATATVAQIADNTKQKTLFVNQLIDMNGERLQTASEAAQSAKNAGLDQYLARPARFECLECSAKHSKSVCPNCGSSDKIENAR